MQAVGQPRERQQLVAAWATLAVLAALAVPAALLAPMAATRAQTSDAPAPVATIPIVFARFQVRLPVSIGDSEPFHLILDTGMPSRGLLLRDTPRVQALGLEFKGSQSLAGAGQADTRITGRTATVPRITMGDLTLSDIPVTVLPPDAGPPRETDGIIGAELFEAFTVRVDVDRLRLELFDSATWEPGAAGKVVPLRFRERSAFVDALVTVDAGEPVKADLAVDLGSGLTLWLNEGKGGRLAPPTATLVTTLGHGLSGAVHGCMGRVRRVELGGFELQDIVAAFPRREHQKPGGFDFRDGFVGAELLTRFTVTFDYAGKRMVLERGRRFDEPFEYDMTGMVLDPRGIERRSIDAVLAGSPAEQAGVQPGDVLVSVDGEPVAAMGPDRLRRALRRDGAEVTLTLERGSTILEMRLRLRRLV